MVGNRVFLWGNAEPSGRLQHAQFDVHAGGGRHVHQSASNTVCRGRASISAAHCAEYAVCSWLRAAISSLLSWFQLSAGVLKMVIIDA